jgi:hypothetical protein
MYEDGKLLVRAWHLRLPTYVRHRCLPGPGLNQSKLRER